MSRAVSLNSSYIMLFDLNLSVTYQKWVMAQIYIRFIVHVCITLLSSAVFWYTGLSENWLLMLDRYIHLNDPVSIKILNPKLPVFLLR